MKILNEMQMLHFPLKLCHSAVSEWWLALTLQMSPWWVRMPTWDFIDVNLVSEDTVRILMKTMGRLSSILQSVPGSCIFFGVPSYTKFVVFLNIVQKAVDSPLVLNIAEQFSFDGFHKKCVNVCRTIHFTQAGSTSPLRKSSTFQEELCSCNTMCWL